MWDPDHTGLPGPPVVPAVGGVSPEPCPRTSEETDPLFCLDLKGGIRSRGKESSVELKNPWPESLSCPARSSSSWRGQWGAQPGVSGGSPTVRPHPTPLHSSRTVGGSLPKPWPKGDLPDPHPGSGWELSFHLSFSFAWRAHQLERSGSRKVTGGPTVLHSHPSKLGQLGN